MDSTGVIEELIDGGIVRDDGDDFHLTPEFEQAVDRESVATADVEDGIASFVNGRSDGRLVLEDAGDTAELLAEYRSLEQFVDADGDADRLSQLAIVDLFCRPPTTIDGVPDAFLPVHGDLLQLLVESRRVAVVYVWRHDCEPCDLVRGDFEELFDAPPDDLALFAVYGPEWTTVLEERFDVYGAPTVLFMVNGRVDARLVGAHQPAALETEIETLREQLRTA